MSSVLAIGIEPTDLSEELAAALSEAGFTPAAPVASSDPLMNETIHHAQAQAPGHVWFVAVRDGHVDLDRIYSFAALAEDGPFAALLEHIAHDAGLGRVAVWVYDLADGRVDRQAEEPLSRLVETLTRAYQAGGPMRSAYHEFVGRTRLLSPTKPT
jgi:hypothetical protein